MSLCFDCDLTACLAPRQSCGTSGLERNARSPFCVVDSISKPRRVYDGEPQLDPLFLDANGVFDDVDCLTDPLCRHIRKMNYIYTNNELQGQKRHVAGPRVNKGPHLLHWEPSCVCTGQ